MRSLPVQANLGMNPNLVGHLLVLGAVQDGLEILHAKVAHCAIQLPLVPAVTLFP